MLILSRKRRQSFDIQCGTSGEVATITIVGISNECIRVGIEAPQSMRVRRSELRPIGGAIGDAIGNAAENATKADQPK